MSVLLDLFGNFTKMFSAMTDSFFVGNMCYIVIVIVSCVFIIYKRNSMRRGYTLFALFSLLLLSLIVYNPILNSVLNKFASEEDNISIRFWLLCPLWLVIAYAFSSNDLSPSKKINKAFPVIVGAIIVFSGSTIDILNMYNSTSNMYKIRGEAVEIADEILSLDCESNPSVLVFEPKYSSEDNYVQNGTIYYGLKQYTGNILTYPYYYTEEEWNEYLLPEILWDGKTLSKSYINGILLWYKELYYYDFVALPKEESFIAKMDYCGYQLVGEAGGYYIFEYSNP